MDAKTLKATLSECRANGQKTAVYFCSHVPHEILEAAGFTAIRVSHIEGVETGSPPGLPANLCPLVKETYRLLSSGVFDDADLVITESSCDGKKKMFELITDREKLYYYQVPQGEERDYVIPLIRSECRWLISYIEKRFGIEVTRSALREACRRSNEERYAFMELMELQKEQPPRAWGREIYEAATEARELTDPQKRMEILHERYKSLSERQSPVSRSAKRILITGCPIGGVYGKVIKAVEENGGVIAAFENCEMIDSCQRRTDIEAEDMVSALAECYQNTPCAIMSPNSRRFQLIKELARDYRVDGVLDVALTTCHAYTVERDRMRRFCRELELPYVAIDTDMTDADFAQITTRTAAFIEML